MTVERSELEGLFTKGLSEPRAARDLFDRLVRDKVICFREIQVSAPPAEPSGGLEGLRQGKDGHSALCRAAAHWVESLGMKWWPEERYPEWPAWRRLVSGNEGMKCDVAADGMLIECGKTQKQKIPALLTALPGWRLIVFPSDGYGAGVEFFVPHGKRQDALNWGRAVGLSDVYYSVQDPCVHCVNSVKELASVEFVGQHRLACKAACRCEFFDLRPHFKHEMVEGRFKISDAPPGIVAAVLAIPPMSKEMRFPFGCGASELRVPGHDHEALIRSYKERALVRAKSGMEDALGWGATEAELLKVLRDEIERRA